MSKDLTSMIEEINTASAVISKTTKPDDPVSFSESFFRLGYNLTLPAFANCPCLEWSSFTAAIDRSKYISIASKSRSRSERKPEVGLETQWDWWRCSRRLLSIVCWKMICFPTSPHEYCSGKREGGVKSTDIAMGMLDWPLYTVQFGWKEIQQG